MPLLRRWRWHSNGGGAAVADRRFQKRWPKPITSAHDDEHQTIEPQTCTEPCACRRRRAQRRWSSRPTTGSRSQWLRAACHTQVIGPAAAAAAAAAASSQPSQSPKYIFCGDRCSIALRISSAMLLLLANITTPEVRRSSLCVTCRSARACSLASTATNELRR